ncbi:hypothetical protein GC096_29670 [Paenibacillus sp. LMG 31461]|uniref:PIN like domain-containing protein n=1 Tax=Paenibacillus plantarum TaxID=2654975 RepID=A0ABX1XIH9_9BACL|nr:PIN-like domain-containing protein [Paenibacillus plantarum]NOU68204.1 hypothetical protein [Paenibacillus plantarum]
MREKFISYYRPTVQEFDQLWNEAIFVFDANVLLNCYRYSSHLRDSLFTIFEVINDRLWVPHQAALEYQENRLTEIIKQENAYDNINKILLSKLNEIKSEIDKFSRHLTIDVSDIYIKIKETVDVLCFEIKTKKETHPNLLNNDEIGDKLTSLLSNRIGDPYTQEKLTEINEIGEKRYINKIPPGYKDISKTEKKYFDDLVLESKFGDLILWFQILEKAIQENKSIILVTDDVKEDWWKKESGKIIGPQPSLIQEMKRKANVGFYMYQTDQFLDFANKFFQINTSQKVIDEQINEIKSVRETLMWVNENISSGKFIRSHFRTKKDGTISELLFDDYINNNSAINLATKHKPPVSLHEYIRRTIIPILNINENFLEYLTIGEFNDYINTRLKEVKDDELIALCEEFGWINNDLEFTDEGLKNIIQALDNTDNEKSSQ